MAQSRRPVRTRKTPQRINALESRMEAEDSHTVTRSSRADAVVRSTAKGERMCSLEGAESVYRLVIEEMDQGALLLQPDGLISYCNRRFAELVQTPLEQVIGGTMARFVPPEEWAVCLGLLKAAQRCPPKTRLTLLPSTGLPLIIQCSIQLVLSSGEALVGMVVNDLTAVLGAEEALRDSEERFQAFMRSFPGCAFIKNADRRYVFLNQRFEQFFGIRREDWIGKRNEDIWPPEVAAELRRHDEMVLTERRPIEVDEHIPQNGSYRTYRSYKFPIDLPGQAPLIGGLAIDETDRKLMEGHIIQTQRLATLGQLLSGIAHELKNPLFVMMGRLDLVQERLARHAYDALPTDLQKIQAAAHGMLSTIQRFLSAAKPYEPKPVHCQVEDILSESLDFLSNELTKNSIQVVIEYAPQKPLVSADPRKIYDVFLSLILNAIEAMKEGHGRGRLTVTTSLTPPSSPQGASFIDVRIQDDGPGIAPEHRNRLFEPFFTTKPPDKGTGLGLWSARSLLLMLNGDLTCESDPGQGATFIVRLPIARHSHPR